MDLPAYCINYISTVNIKPSWNVEECNMILPVTHLEVCNRTPIFLTVHRPLVGDQDATGPSSYATSDRELI